MARWPRGGVPTRRQCASAMRCAVTAVTASHSRRAIAATALLRRRASPSGAREAGAGGEKLVTAGGPHQSGAAGAVGGALRVRPVAVTAAVGRLRRTGAVARCTARRPGGAAAGPGRPRGRGGRGGAGGGGGGGGRLGRGGGPPQGGGGGGGGGAPRVRPVAVPAGVGRPRRTGAVGAGA